MAGSLRMVLGLAAIGGEMSGALARLVWERTSKTGRLRQSLRRLECTGAIAVHGSGPLDARIVRLTTAGRILAQADVNPPALWARPWDGAWRIVAFDIPDSATALRTRLRRKLRARRFGWLQNSVWIGPDPIDEFRAELNETNLVPESLTCFQARPIGGESHEALVNSAWDFERLAKNHTSYLEILRLRPGRSRGLAAWLGWLETEHRAWLQIARNRPILA